MEEPSEARLEMGQEVAAAAVAGLMGVGGGQEAPAHLKVDDVVALEVLVPPVGLLLSSGGLWTTLHALFFERTQDHWISVGNAPISA